MRLRAFSSLFLFASLAFAHNVRAFEPLLPDPKLTPGKVASKAGDISGVKDAMRAKVFARYRVPPARRGDYVIDHLIPRELGGADHVENLWPQRIGARPYGPSRKKLLTDRFVQMVATNRMTLAEAQRELAEDWVSAFVIHIGMVYLLPGSHRASDNGETGR